MVSLNSMKYFNINSYTKNYILKNSWHYYYDKKDFLFIKEKLLDFFCDE